jgi:uncharacterized protein YneF (UPF0154 family)
MKTLPTRTTLAIIVLLIVATFLFLLIFPYYFLGREAYIPKSNPDYGYFLPKSLEAWLFFAVAWAFFALSFVILAFYIRRKQAEDSR